MCICFSILNTRVGQSCALFHFKYQCLLNVNESDLFVEKEFICMNAEIELPVSPQLGNIIN